MSTHRRDDEDNSFEHERRNDMPIWMRWGLDAFQKVGFPAGMCLLIWWRSETKERDLADSMLRQAATLQSLVKTEQDLVNTITINHQESKERWEHYLAEFRGSRK